MNLVFTTVPAASSQQPRGAGGKCLVYCETGGAALAGTTCPIFPSIFRMKTNQISLIYFVVYICKRESLVKILFAVTSGTWNLKMFKGCSNFLIHYL